MSTIYSFDQLTEQLPQDNTCESPFWTLDLKDEDKVKGWVTWNWDRLKTRDFERMQSIMANMAAYRGVQYKIQDSRSKSIDTSTHLLRHPKVVVNQLHDIVEQDVSKMTVYRPNVNCTPASSDNSDVITARIGDDLTTYAFDRENVDGLFETMERQKKIIGESYAVVRWSDSIGPVDDDYAEASRKYKRIPLVGEDGKQVIGDNGEPLYVDKVLRQGDFYYDTIFSWNLQFERRSKYTDSRWAIWCEYLNADDIRAKYPDKADEVKATTPQYMTFDPESFEALDYRNVTEVFHFIHKPSDTLGRGYYVCCTRDCILEQGELPEYWRCEDEAGRPDFPFVRLTDIDPPGCLRGYSTLEYGRQLQGLYNNFTSMMAKAIFVAAHPKWMVPRGTVKIESLGNDASIVQYKGPVPPQVAAFQPVSAAVWQGRQEIRQDLQNVMASSGVSRGEPPPGVKAWHAIQYLDELENERRNSSIAKHNFAIKDLAVKSLRMMGCKYDNKRIEKIIGRAQKGDLKGFDPKSLCSLVNVKAQVASGLARQKSMRVSQIIDLRAEFPGLIPDEQVVDLLDIGNEEGFKSAATTSVRMAQYENEQLLRSGKIESPEVYEQHIVHYATHIKLLEDKTFKLTVPANWQKAAFEHVEATEMLMYEAGKKNPMYMAQVLQRFPQYPVFFDPEAIGELPALAVASGAGMQQQAQGMAPQQAGGGMPPPAPGAELTTTARNPLAENAAVPMGGEAAIMEGAM